MRSFTERIERFLKLLRALTKTELDIITNIGEKIPLHLWLASYVAYFAKTDDPLPIK